MPKVKVAVGPVVARAGLEDCEGEGEGNGAPVQETSNNARSAAPMLPLTLRGLLLGTR